MMLSMVGLKRAFMASGLILSIPCEDHFTKSTLGGGSTERKSSEHITIPTDADRHRHRPWQSSCQGAERGFQVLGDTLTCQDLDT